MMVFHRQYGFSYLSLLFTIAIAGIFLAQAGMHWSQENQREKEQELLFIGQQFRQAIMLYYLRTPSAAKQYPRTLDDLLTDNRFNPPAHYLRRLYRDPVSNSPQWGLITAPEGGIMGIHSLSTRTPLKQKNFTHANRAFEGKGQYSSWEFIYRPETVR